MLTVRKLTKHFGGVNAVDNCSFEVMPGQITALIGPNGAGKTTLFNCVAGVVPFERGTVRFSGQDITRLSIHRRARLGISRTFQLTRTFANMTVEENLRLAAEPRDQDFWRALFLPDTVGVAQTFRSDDVRAKALSYKEVLKKKLEDTLKLVGLEQPLGYPAKNLSYGQAKLLSLARALLMPHKLLMLDEPVAGVAPTLRDQFKKLLPELQARGETIFFIEHDMDFVRAVADAVIVMEEGRVLTEGSPEAVLKDPRVLEAYLGEQL